jgi:hypothetical protein
LFFCLADGAKIRAMPTTNTFYIAANIIFDLATGETKNVLMLVNKPEQASIFSAEDAQKYVNFVKARASTIIWSPEQLTSRNAFADVLGSNSPRFIIKGVQYV